MYKNKNKIEIFCENLIKIMDPEVQDEIEKTEEIEVKEDEEIKIFLDKMKKFYFELHNSTNLNRIEFIGDVSNRTVLKFLNGRVPEWRSVYNTKEFILQLAHECPIDQITNGKHLDNYSFLNDYSYNAKRAIFMQICIDNNFINIDSFDDGGSYFVIYDELENLDELTEYLHFVNNLPDSLNPDIEENGGGIEEFNRLFDIEFPEYLLK
jgi:hypothetical protein